MDVKAFWESDEAVKANKRDWILKELEIREIAKHVKPGMRILDVGCGDGETLIELCSRFEIEALGVDRSEAMIQIAVDNELRARRHPHRLKMNPFFYEGQFDVMDIPASIAGQRFDLIYTERSLINLSDWPTQQQAIRNILALLKPGGKYLMVEHSLDGLVRLNDWRATIGLDAIPVPAHNRYFSDDEVAELMSELWSDQGIEGNEVPYCFASTYYILSRIVNAAMANEEGHEPSYDAFVNKLALKLPNGGNIGHGAIWVWRKPE